MRHHRTRVTAVLALVVVAVAALTAGLGTASARPQATTLRMMVIVNIPTFKAGFDELVRRFEASQSDIKIELTTLPSTQYDQVLRTQLLAGQGPDVFHVVQGSGLSAGVTPLAKANMLTDLSKRPWVTKVPKLLQPLAQYRGKTYAYWLDFSSVLTYYNVDLFNQLGLKPPRTLNALVDICRTVKRERPGIIPIVAPLGLPIATTLFSDTLSLSSVYANDPRWETKRAARKVTFAGSADWQLTFSRYQRLGRECFQPTPTGTNTQQQAGIFATGRAAMTLSTTQFVGVLLSINPGLRAGTFVFPASNDPAKVTVAGGPIVGLGVNNRSSNKAAAIRFVDFVSQPVVTRSYAAKLKAIPSVDIIRPHKLPPLFRLLVPALREGRLKSSPAAFWPNAGVTDALQSGVQALFTGQKSINDVLTSMDAAYDRR